ncbi:hypothetical protein K474DRAFT_1655954 [Panus rudis PR-1116 ss-1]|nr:hypothetical protein K474DRAFT_1655954 [Panus rudis PR-1116 ss-1]
MAQGWKLYNVSTRQFMPGPCEESEFKYMFLSEKWHILVKYLAKPTGYKKKVTWRKVNIAKFEHKKQLGALSRLPDEILLMIFEASLDAWYRDDDRLNWTFFTLGITNTYLAEIAYEVVQRHFVYLTDNWFCNRLICVGHNASVDAADLPPRAFRKDDVDAMASHKTLQDYLDFKCIYPHSRSDVQGFDLEKAPKALQLHSECYSGNNPTARQQAECLLDLSTPRLLYDGPYSDWVLADLDTGEFVRLWAILALQNLIGDATGPFVDKVTEGRVFGLGHVLLSRICYSTDPSQVALQTDGLSYAQNRGPWAGHHFTITTRRDLDRERGWKDISGKVAKDVEAILRGCFGNDWRRCARAPGLF